MLFTSALPKRIEVGGASVEYLRTGSGPTLLYLHGFDGISPDDPFIAPLAQHFEVIAPSLPGFGASSRPKEMRTIADLTRFVVAFARSLALKDAVLVGSSFGGWVAAEIASHGRTHFSRLVLADAVGARFTKDPTEREIVDIFTIEAKRYPPFLFSDAALALKVFNNLDFANMNEDAALRFCTNREGMTQFGWAPLLHNTGLRSRLSQIDIPVLVLWGADDRIVSVNYGQQFAATIPGSKFEMIAEAGHYLPLEKPGEFARRVASFGDIAQAA